MRLTWRDGLATVVTGLFVIGYIGLVQAASWAPATSVRWFAAAFVVLGLTTCAVTAGDMLQDGPPKGTGSVLGPVALVAGLGALVTGSTLVMGVGVLAMVVLWVVSTLRHLQIGRQHEVRL